MPETRKRNGVTRRQFIWSMSGGGLVALGQRRIALAQPRAKVVLRGISSFEKASIFNKAYLELIVRIEKKSGGELVIEWKGGPEAVPSFQTVEAVGKGVFDVALSTASYYAAGMTEAVAIQTEQPSLSLQALHASGAVGLLDEIHREKLNVTLLGIPVSGVGYVFMTKKPPRTLDSLKGTKIRSIPIYTPLLRALGAATVTLPPYEIYTALERGVVDGLGWSGFGIEEFKFQEVAKYMMLPMFYAVRLSLVMNRNAFARLTPSLQKALVEAVQETDEWGRKYIVDETTREHERLQKAGMEKISLSDVEAKRFLEIAHETLWAQIVKDSPKNGPRLKEAFAKAAQMG